MILCVDRYVERINLYDKQTCKITPFPDARLLDKGINYMAADKEDNIWIGAGNTIYRCNSTASIVKEYDIFGSQQNSMPLILFIRIEREICGRLREEACSDMMKRQILLLLILH